MTKPASALQAVTAALEAAGLVETIHGPRDVEISGVTQDSRTVQSGNLFLAWRGSDWDAHDFVARAAEMGAAAAVVERFVPEAEILQIQVSDGRLAAALAADAQPATSAAAPSMSMATRVRKAEGFSGALGLCVPRARRAPRPPGLPAGA